MIDENTWTMNKDTIDNATQTVDNTANTVQPAGAETPSAVEVKPEKRRYPWLAIISLALCIVSWYLATRSGFATLASGSLAIIAGAFALGSKRPAVRNTAITSIVATGVLILVVGAFIIALRQLLG